MLAPPGECLPKSEERRISSNERSTEATVQRAVTSPRAHHRVRPQLPADAPDEKTPRKISFYGADSGAVTPLRARALGCSRGQRVEALPRDREDRRREICLHRFSVTLHQRESRDRPWILSSKLFLDSHPSENRERLMREKTPADLVARKARLLEDDNARPGAREGACRGRAREAAADHRDVAIVLQGRFQTSSQT